MSKRPRYMVRPWTIRYRLGPFGEVKSTRVYGLSRRNAVDVLRERLGPIAGLFAVIVSARSDK